MLSLRAVLERMAQEVESMITRQGSSEPESLDPPIDFSLRARGGGLILVNPAYTSQECFVCGFIAESNRKTQGVFHRLAYHHADHADANAAKFIKKRVGRAPPPRLGSLVRPPFLEISPEKGKRVNRGSRHGKLVVAERNPPLSR